MTNRKNLQGFTLLELMITLSIVIILTTIGMPSFMELIRDGRLKSNASDVLTGLNFARSEAITRNIQITVRSNNATASDWDNGWNIFTDFNGNGTCDDGCDATNTGEDELLKSYGGVPQGFTLRTGGNFTTWMAYLPNGASDASGPNNNDTFRLCGDNASTVSSRSITISLVGRPRVSKGTIGCS